MDMFINTRHSMVKLKLNEELAIYTAVVVFQRLIFMNSFFLVNSNPKIFFSKVTNLPISALFCP